MTRIRPATVETRRQNVSSRVSRHFETGHTFLNPGLLEMALTHSSLLHENPSLRDTDTGASAPDNEQLEFLGDAVLSLVVAEILFRDFSSAREGDLTRLRASVVSSKHLAAIAADLDLGAYLRLGRGEDHSGGRRKPALLADALEAVIAALYLDGGLPAASAFIEREIVAPALPDLRQALAAGATIGDYKSALQEKLQASGLGQPRYVLTDESGPDHKRLFRVAVQIQSSEGTVTLLAESEGPTKKRAQQEAARLALSQLQHHVNQQLVRQTPPAQEAT